MKQGISIIGAPLWLGQRRYGVNMGPDAIRAAGLVRQLRTITEDIIDLGNIDAGSAVSVRELQHNLRNLKPVAASCQRLAEGVADIIGSRRLPLILGGDHSMAIGTLAGVARHYKNPGVIWYDAHTDINTPETTPSGNIHGMPLAVAMGFGHPLLTQIGGPGPKVRPDHIVFIGVRDIDPGERALIEKYKMKTYTAADVKRRGIKQVIAETLSYLRARCDGIHLSFDLDGIDPAEAPGVGTPAQAGISLADSLAAVRMLAGSGMITSAEFVELNPILDEDDKTARIAVAMIGNLLGGNSGDNITDEETAAIPLREAAGAHR
jgi:arginase